jgi:hypothetical protein
MLPSDSSIFGKLIFQAYLPSICSQVPSPLLLVQARSGGNA